MTHTPEIIDYRYDVSEAFEQRATPEQDVSPAATAPRQHPGLVEQFSAIVRSSPCATNVTEDYADARYYLTRAVASETTSSSALAVVADLMPGVRQCLTATNLAELPGQTHLLSAGTVVQVFALYTRPGVKCYVFNQPPPDGAVVQITGTADGGGKYTGRILTGQSTAEAAGDLAMPEGLSIPASDNALILNAEEDGLDGHRLRSGSYAVGQIAGTLNGSTIIVIRGALGATGGPTTLGPGSGLDADGTIWSKDDDGTPVDVWIQSRTYWDSDSGTLYGYQRKFSFDARGVLYAIGGESQFVIDAAVECS